MRERAKFHPHFKTSPKMQEALLVFDDWLVWHKTVDAGVSWMLVHSFLLKKLVPFEMIYVGSRLFAIQNFSQVYLNPFGIFTKYNFLWIAIFKLRCN